jgi:predicted nucleic acid-binding protein
VIGYVDANALVKLHITEAGSADTGQHLTSQPWVTSDISGVEVAAAFHKRGRIHPNDGGIPSADAAQAVADFDADWPNYRTVPVTDEVLIKARELTAKYPLRAYDAVHVASAWRLTQIVTDTVEMISFDDKVREAASQEGFPLWPSDAGVYKPAVAPSVAIPTPAPPTTPPAQGS